MVFAAGIWVGGLLGLGFATLVIGSGVGDEALSPAERAFDRELRSWDAPERWDSRWDRWGESR